MLDLVSTRDHRANWRGEIATEPLPTGGYRLTFAFEKLPSASTSSRCPRSASYRWAPVSVHVRPPLEGVTFTRFDLDTKLALGFNVFDAATGARIESFQTRHLQLTPSADNGVFLHTGPIWTLSRRVALLVVAVGRRIRGRVRRRHGVRDARFQTRSRSASRARMEHESPRARAIRKRSKCAARKC
jgi:hypothetical protein